MLAFGFRRIAEHGMVSNDTDDYLRQAVKGFTAGVNAYAQSVSMLPIEYLLTGNQFRPWELADCTVIGVFASFQVSPFWSLTIMRTKIAKILGTEMANEILQPVEQFNAFDKFPSIVSESQLKLRNLFPDKLFPKFLYPKTKSASTHTGDKTDPIELHITGGHSNAWAISGKYTKSGKPLLASDPHVGSSQPVLFYGANLALQSGAATGYMIPGAPVFLFGRNTYAAWGMTSSYIENSDVYELKLDMERKQYFHDGKWKDLIPRKNIIRPKGQKEFVHLTYETHHGAVLFPVGKKLGAALPDP